MTSPFVLSQSELFSLPFVSGQVSYLDYPAFDSYEVQNT